MIFRENQPGQTVRVAVELEVAVLFIPAGQKHEQWFTLPLCGSVAPTGRAGFGDRAVVRGQVWSRPGQVSENHWANQGPQAQGS